LVARAPQHAHACSPSQTSTRTCTHIGTEVKSLNVIAAVTSPTSSVLASGGGFWAKGVEKYAPNAGLHNSDIRTVCVATNGFLDNEAFQTWLEDLLWERRHEDSGPDILRAKGLIYTKGSDKRRVLQAVREIYEITDGPVEENPDDVMNKLVFIGRNLDEGGLETGLKSCVAQ